MSESPFSRVGVVGLGLIGGSVALSARRTWPGIVLVGLDRSSAVAASARGPVVHETADSVTDLASCDLIVLAVPPTPMLELMPELARLDTRAVMTDVGSTKRQVIAAANRGGLARFVGGHPMAGSEREGLTHARANLFDGRPWMLVAGTGDTATERRVEAFVSGLGAAPHWIDVDVHDRAVAYVSHLPQLVSVALMNAATEAVGDDGRAASGRAFAEMTRLASSPPALWQDILSTNVDFVTEALEQFIARLPTGDDLDRGRWVQDAFGRAAAAREKIRKKHDDGQP